MAVCILLVHSRALWAESLVDNSEYNLNWHQGERGMGLISCGKYDGGFLYLG